MEFTYLLMVFTPKWLGNKKIYCYFWNFTGQPYLRCTLTLLCFHSPLYVSPLTQRNSPIPSISLSQNSPVNRSPFLKVIPPWTDIIKRKTSLLQCNVICSQLMKMYDFTVYYIYICYQTSNCKCCGFFGTILAKLSQMFTNG